MNHDLDRDKMTARILALVFLGCTTLSHAQSTVRPADTIPSKEETVSLSPFTVTSDRDRGYGVSNTVGATRINVPIAEVPQSITVLNAEFLKDLGGAELADAAKYVSGVTVAGAPNSGQLTLRGWNTTGANYRDGLVDPIYQHGGSAIDMSSFERVEFVKGPSGTLYGTHITGGIINLVSKVPQPNRRTTLRTTFGDYNFLRTDIDTTGPVDAGKKLLYRVVVGYQDAENMQGLVNDRLQVTPSISYHPTEDTQVLFRYAYQNPKNSVNSFHWFADKDYRISTFLPKELPLTERDDLRENEIHQFDVDVIHGFNVGDSRWDMRLKARYNDVFAFWRVYSWGEAVYRFVDAGGNVIGTTQNTSFSDPRWTNMIIGPRVFQERKIRVKEANFNYDVTGDFRIGPTEHKLLTYLSYVPHENSGSSLLWDYPAINLNNRVYHPDPKAVATNRRVGFRNSTRAQTFAWGVQDNVSFLDDRVIVVGGARYDRINNDFIDHLTNIPTSNVRSDWSYRFGVVGKPMAGTSLFYNYSETFSPITGINTVTNQPWKNQTGSTNEVGAKLELFDSRLITTVSYFEQELNNARITVDVRPDPVTGGLINIIEQRGISKTEGWELDFVALPTKNIALMGSFGDLDSTTERRIRQRAVPIGPSYRLWGKYSFTEGAMKGLYLGLGFEHTAERDMDGTGNGNLPEFETWDGLVGYRWRNWDFQVNGYNLFDENYASIAVAKFLIYGGDTRKVRATVTWTF